MALSNAYRPEDQLMQKLKNRFATTGRPASRGEVLGAMEGSLADSYAKARGAASVNEQRRQFDVSMAFNREREAREREREDQRAKSQGMAGMGSLLGAGAGFGIGVAQAAASAGGISGAGGVMAAGAAGPWGIGAAVGAALIPMIFSDGK